MVEIRQLTDVCHCNFQHHLSCNLHRALRLGPGLPGAATQDSQRCPAGLTGQARLIMLCAQLTAKSGTK
jgi:hypothetical protein